MNMKDKFVELPVTKQKAIKDLHKLAEIQVQHIDVLSKQLQNATSSYSAKACVYLLRHANLHLAEIEYRLQEMWGFKQDSKYHTWWLKCTECTCPKQDNMDPLYYGSGHIYIDTCPVHGNIDDIAVNIAVDEYLTDFQQIELELKGVNDIITIKGWFSNGRINEHHIPKGMYKYALRHSDGDDSKPATLEPNVGVNLFGEILTKTAIEFPPEDGYYSIADYNFI